MMHKISKHIVATLVKHNVDTLICGKNDGWKDSIHIGKQNNQTFVQIPHDTFISYLRYKCEMQGITFITNEESYTSKCDALAREEICNHDKYLGKRTKRGLFQSSVGKLLNADVNGALNIMRKVVGDSEVVSRITNSGWLYQPIIFRSVYALWQIINKINKINPDIVVLTGDIFDNEYSAIDNPDRILELLNSIKTRYGKFVVYGNHDIEEKVLCGFSFSYKNPSEVSASQEMNDFIKNAGFTLLYDNGISINDENGKFITYIYGRPDAKKFNLGNSERIAAKDITKGYDHDKYFICLDHQPGELKELQEAGVDLDLSGHTHKGQMWPGTISINWLWDNAYGMLNLDNMTSIVTSGVGLFGPNMRIDSIAEIVQISILFNNEN